MEELGILAQERRINWDIMANVVHALVEIRKDAGLTVEESADLLCITPEKMQKLEDKGEKHHIPVHKFLRMVAAYGGHVVIETKTGSYSLEELTKIPPVTWEERDMIAIAQKEKAQRKMVKRNHDWLNQMAENWNDEDE